MNQVSAPTQSRTAKPSGLMESRKSVSKSGFAAAENSVASHSVVSHSQPVSRDTRNSVRPPLGEAVESRGPRVARDFSHVQVHGQTPIPERATASHARSASGGQLLPAQIRNSFEKQFRAPLSSVRIHDDDNAASRNRKQQANAMTIGEDIHFGKGRYRPFETAGRRLLAHELTHVLQQRGSGARSSVSASEAEARVFSDRSVAGGSLPPVRQNIRASHVAPLLDKSKAREVLEDELDDLFCNVTNAWPEIRKTDPGELKNLREDEVLERNIRRRADEKDLLKTYLLLNYQTEEQFPPHYEAFIEATYKWGTDEARIYSILRGVDQPTRAEMQKMPGFVEVIRDEMSGAELQQALTLLSENEQHSGKATSKDQESTHLELGKRYALDANARGGFETVQSNLEEAFTFGKESSAVILDDTSLWAEMADKYDREEVWYLRMIARYAGKANFPVADTQTVSFVTIIWDAVSGCGTKEKKLITGLEEVNKATGFKSGGGGRMLFRPPFEVRMDPWFVPMLESELSGDDLEKALNAVSAKESKPVAGRDSLRSAIDKKDMNKIREILQDPKLTPVDRNKLKDDPEILSEMGDELRGAELCETSQLLEYGAAVPKLVSDLLAFFQGKKADVAGAVAYLTGLSAADQDQMLKEPGVYFMLSDLSLGAGTQKLLAAVRSKDPKWQTPGSEGYYTTYKETTNTTMPVSFTSSEARLSPKMNVDTKLVSKENGKPFKVKSGIIEDWIRAIDEVWNNKYRIRSGTGNLERRLALVFDPYMAHGMSGPDVSVVVENTKGRSWALYPEMHLFLGDLDAKTVAHEFGHIMGNPDEYRLTPTEYTRIGGKPGKAPVGGEDLKTVMASQDVSLDIEVRHVSPAVEIINKVRDPLVYPDPFVPEKT